MWTLLGYRNVFYSRHWMAVDVPMGSLPATPYSPHVMPSETGSLSCKAAKTAKEEDTSSFITLLAQANFHLIHTFLLGWYSESI